jgi:hypothetical protein
MCRGEPMFQDVRSFMALSWKDGMTFADHGKLVSRSRCDPAVVAGLYS